MTDLTNLPLVRLLIRKRRNRPPKTTLRLKLGRYPHSGATTYLEIERRGTTDTVCCYVRSQGERVRVRVLDCFTVDEEAS